MSLRYLKIRFWVGLVAAVVLIASPVRASVSPTPAGTEPSPATSSNTASVSSLTATETLDHAGQFEVQEYFTVTPGTNSPATVTQRIPIAITDDQGNTLPSTFKILGATTNGRPVNLTNSTNGSLATITFALANSPGPQKFSFKYSLEPVILAGPTADIFKISATGLDWSATVQSALILLTTPGLSPQDLTCYTGVSGSTSSNCRIVPKGASTNLITTDAALAPGASLELYAGFPRHSFTAYYNSWHFGLLLPFAIGAGIVIVLIIALSILAGRRLGRRSATADHDRANS